MTPHVGFWVCFAGVMINAGFAVFGPVPEAAKLFALAGAMFGIGAFTFYLGIPDDEQH